MKDFKIAVVALIEEKGEILIGKKKKGDSFLSGEWHIPGGKLLSGENEEDGLKREIKEETGLDIAIKSFFGEYFISSSKRIVKWYLCHPTGGDLHPGSDLEDAKFVRKKEVFSFCSDEALRLFPEAVSAYLKD